MKRLTKRIPGGVKINGTKFLLGHSDSNMRKGIWRAAELEDFFDQIGLTPAEVADLARAKQGGAPPSLDYICAIRHYEKYGDEFTFAQTTQWFNLRFGSYERFQEFTMQLAFLMAAARKKYDQERRDEAEKAVEESQ